MSRRDPHRVDASRRGQMPSAAARAAGYRAGTQHGGRKPPRSGCPIKLLMVLALPLASMAGGGWWFGGLS